MNDWGREIASATRDYWRNPREWPERIDSDDLQDAQKEDSGAIPEESEVNRQQ